MYILEINHSIVSILYFYLVLSLPELFGVEKATNPITGLHEKDHNLNVITRRNMQLYNRFRDRMYSVENDCSKSSRHEIEMKRIEESRRNLPIAEFR